jgi:hypothetical protein
MFIRHFNSIFINRLSTRRHVSNEILQAIFHRENHCSTNIFHNHASKNASSQISQNLNGLIADERFFRRVS